MNIVGSVRNGLEELEITPFINSPIVTADGEYLDANAKSLIWAMAASAGYRDAGRFFQDYGITANENESIIVAAYKDNLRREFVNMQKDDPSLVSFDEYFDAFPAKLRLSDGRWLIWTE